MAAGFYGLLDFVGYPVGAGGVTPAGGRGNFQGAGRKILRAMALADMERDASRRVMQARAESRRRLVENAMRIAKARFDAELVHHRKMAEIATYSILMAEA